MPDDTNDPSSTASSTHPRQKQHHKPNVRSRTSPPPGEQDARPPTKRARKAINCEPCRNSKLKCDRNRPCSSCVLRGTIALCYQDAPLPCRNASRVDPMQEIVRLKHSVSLLETYIIANHRPGNPSLPPHLKRTLDNPSNLISPKKESTDGENSDKDNAPGMLGSHGHQGFYAGPTAAVTHLALGDVSRQSEEGERHPSQDFIDDFTASNEYDKDLIAHLPSIEIMDGLVTYYFEYCNWIYRHVNRPAFTAAWERFKTGASADRITLAYLMQQTHQELGRKFYEVMRTALNRHRAECKTYSLELVECLLVRCHYLTLSKTDSEEIWTVRGELIAIGTAMGLHRDPLKWRMSREVAERRRWAWWHIILLERWQAFMFGRPLAIASHHFDTQLPSANDPVQYPSEPRIYLPNLALFRLAYILGDIMDSAVSLRPVPYEVVQANDRSLTQWMDSLPSELDLDEFKVARSLASPDVTTRRIGVQSVIIRTSYYHIRFTLHRPYATAPSGGPKTPKDGDNESPSATANGKDLKAANSLDIAVGSADKLITLVGQARPDFLANASLAVPGHMNWGPFHVFSAAMFFSFQLVANPEQPGASLFRANIQKALTTLELSRGAPVADKALDILHALAPLYSPDFATEDEGEREQKKLRVLGLVKTLAFPYHDSPKYPRTNSLDSPNAMGSGNGSSPGTGHSGSPQAYHRGSTDYGMGVGIGGVGMSTLTRGLPPTGPPSSTPLVGYTASPSSYTDANTDNGTVCVTPLPVAGYSDSRTTNNPGSSESSGGTATNTPYADTYSARGTTHPPPPYDPSPSRHYTVSARQPYADSSRQPYVAGGDPGHHHSGASGRYTGGGSGYAGGTGGGGVYHAVESETMWGASVSQSEWVNFLNAMQRPGGGRG
ncbi:fungal-specific transcription factor domain-containing protein [Pisolithus orientalis]|uniref:fungal-specific transcription factor domain-containing protein n=1 Tax=Pisolithus orientalis TaxID=936130 RepID=UPI002225250D|nr:fungal-specific transcription factor domain-containing protein [Pisolithus orientalis]KAI6035557.1 fungal-specific transcription factor domain-containing protein [Pisolithus orientalis]